MTPNNKNMDQLLNMASKKLGMSPQSLKQSLEKGTLDQALKGLNASDSAKLQQAINNPSLAEKMLSTPQAQELIKKLMGK